MERGPQDAAARLAQAVAALSEPSEMTPLGRRIARTGTDLLSALLREVEQTVLARSLVFRTDREARLVLDAGARRILALHEVSAGIDDAALTGRALDDTDAPALAALLAAYVHGAEALHVTALLPGTAPVAGPGLSPRSLLAPRGTAAGHSEDPAGVAFEAGRPHARALALLRPGRPAQRWGEEHLAAELAGLLDAAGTIGPHAATLWLTGDAAAPARLLATGADFQLAGLCDPADAAALFALWHDVLSARLPREL